MYMNIIIKTVSLYFFIALVYRIMGKKEVGKLGIIDLIVSILIAELAALSIERADESIFISVIPISILVGIQLLLGYISMKNEKIRNFIDGKPTVIIKDGKIVFSEMTKLRYTLDDLIAQLREQSIKSIEEVSYAVLENNGKLSIFKKEQDYPMPIILDGVIDMSVVKEIGKTPEWVIKMLKNNKLELKDIFYAFYTKKKTFIIKKNDLL